jgi:hypothetical protein
VKEKTVRRRVRKRRSRDKWTNGGIATKLAGAVRRVPEQYVRSLVSNSQDHFHTPDFCRYQIRSEIKETNGLLEENGMEAEKQQLTHLRTSTTSSILLSSL